MNVEMETALRMWKAFTDADLKIGRDWLRRHFWCGWGRERDLHRHGLTAQELLLRPYRFRPYTIDNTRNEMISRSRAVWFALE